MDTPRTGNSLELRDLSKSYGSLVALDGLSFTVGEGQMFGFVGANGRLGADLSQLRSHSLVLQHAD